MQRQNGSTCRIHKQNCTDIDNNVGNLKHTFGNIRKCKET